MIDEARALYLLDPGDFVAARGRLVKELKAAGRRDEAALVAKLTRPRMGEHTLNRLAHERPDVIASFAEAVGAATTAQAAAISSGDGAAMRTSAAALRAATATLIDAAAVLLARDDRLGPTQRDEIVALVRTLTNDDGIQRLTAGIVGSAGAGSDELFAGAPEPFVTAAKPAREQRAPAKPAPTKRSVASTAEPADDRRALKAATAERARQRRVQAQLDRALLTAGRTAREVAAARRALDAATQRVDAAEAANRAADDEVQALRDELGTGD